MTARFCTSCGAAAAAEARFCGTCGEPLAGAPAADADSAPRRAAQTADPAEEHVFELTPLVIRSVRELLLCILTIGIAWICYWVVRMGRRYVITTQRIEFLEGVVTKRRTALDVFRIEDFEVEQPFFLRMRGAGNLRIWSMDQSEPQMVLAAIPDVQAVYEKLREMTRDERGRHKVRVVEGM